LHAKIANTLEKEKWILKNEGMPREWAGINLEGIAILNIKVHEFGNKLYV